VSDEFVFPQTISGDANFNREGGLTKRELFALVIFAGAPHAFDTPASSYAQAARKADLLLAELEKPR